MKPTTSPPARTGAVTRRTGLLAATAALLSGCSASGALDRLIARDTYSGQPDIGYGADARQRLDVSQPTVAAPAQGFPVVLFFYGGNWTRGDRAGYRFVGEALAANGVLAIVADYRLSPQVRYDGALRDCALATRWVFEQAQGFGGDLTRVMLMGHSAGAYNAAMLALDPRWLRDVGLQPSRLAGWIGLAGPYDFLPIGDPEVQLAFGWPNTPADSQPIAHAGAKAPRTLLIAGLRDRVVDPQRSTASLARLLRAAGTEVHERLLNGLGHVAVMAAMARPLDWLAPVLPTVLAFARGESLDAGG